MEEKHRGSGEPQAMLAQRNILEEEIELDQDTPIETVIDKAESLFQRATLGRIKAWLDKAGSNAPLEQRQRLVAKVDSSDFPKKAKNAFAGHLFRMPETHSFFHGFTAEDCARVIRIKASSEKKTLNADTPINKVINKANIFFARSAPKIIRQWLDKTGAVATLVDKRRLLTRITEEGLAKRAKENFARVILELSENHKFFHGLTEESDRLALANIKAVIESQRLNANTAIETVIEKAETFFRMSLAGHIRAWLDNGGSNASLADRQRFIALVSSSSFSKDAQRNLTRQLHQLPEDHSFFQGFSPQDHDNVRKMIERSSAPYTRLFKKRTREGEAVEEEVSITGEGVVNSSYPLQAIVVKMESVNPAEAAPMHIAPEVTTRPVAMPIGSWQQRVTRISQGRVPSQEHESLTQLFSQLNFVEEQGFGNPIIRQMCKGLKQAIYSYLHFAALPAPVREVPTAVSKIVLWEHMKEWIRSILGGHAESTDPLMNRLQILSEDLGKHAYDTGPLEWRNRCLTDAEDIALDMQESYPTESSQLYAMLGRLTQPELVPITQHSPSLRS